MRVTVDCGPAYAMAYCHLGYQETVHVESDGMALMSDGINVTSGAGGGGVVQGLVRKAFGGESFFMGAYTATVQGAWVAVAPKYPGDVKAIELDDFGPLVAQSGSLLAFNDGVDASVKVAGIQQAVATRGMTLLSIRGTGTVVLAAYGALCEFEVGAGQSLIVDTGHLVAYSDGMKADLGMLGGVVTATTTGEDLVLRLTGPGRVLVQTRAEKQFATWINPMRESN